MNENKSNVTKNIACTERNSQGEIYTVYAYTLREDFQRMMVFHDIRSWRESTCKARVGQAISIAKKNEIRCSSHVREDCLPYPGRRAR